MLVKPPRFHHDPQALKKKGSFVSPLSLNETSVDFSDSLMMNRGFPHLAALPSRYRFFL